MKVSTPSLLIVSMAVLITGCTTEVGPNGQQRSVMTPLGAAGLQAVTAAGIGAGTGALMRGVNPVAAGAMSAGAGSVGSQAINAFIPKSSSGPQYSSQPQNQALYIRRGDGSFVPAQSRYTQQPDGSYAPSYSSGRTLYRQFPDGSFAPAY